MYIQISLFEFILFLIRSSSDQFKWNNINVWFMARVANVEVELYTWTLHATLDSVERREIEHNYLFIDSVYGKQWSKNIIWSWREIKLAENLTDQGNIGEYVKVSWWSLFRFFRVFCFDFMHL